MFDLAFIPGIWRELWSVKVIEELEFWSLHSTTTDIPVLYRAPREQVCAAVPSLRGLRLQTADHCTRWLSASSEEEKFSCSGTDHRLCSVPLYIFSIYSSILWFAFWQEHRNYAVKHGCNDPLGPVKKKFNIIKLHYNSQ
jgi:hypothetical protein